MSLLVIIIQSMTDLSCFEVGNMKVNVSVRLDGTTLTQAMDKRKNISWTFSLVVLRVEQWHYLASIFCYYFPCYNLFFPVFCFTSSWTFSSIFLCILFFPVIYIFRYFFSYPCCLWFPFLVIICVFLIEYFYCFCFLPVIVFQLWISFSLHNLPCCCLPPYLYFLLFKLLSLFRYFVFAFTYFTLPSELY